jgi:putative NIF3 family GTP cyclohydrolase 1 type 2
MSTKEIMELALKLSEFNTVPADSAVYVEGKKIGKILFGIDIDVPELLLAKQLGCDAAISHHPKCSLPLIYSYKVFSRHIQQMVNVGVPQFEAEEAVRKKIQTFQVEQHKRNWRHTLDVARILKIPYLNIHAPLDELGRRIMTRQIMQETSKDATVNDVVLALNKLPEFRNAVTKIKILYGANSNPAGKIQVSHGAFTNGGYEILKTYFKYGITTVIYIHITANPHALEQLKADNVSGNLIVTGHIASDSVGINRFIKELEKREISVIRLGIVPHN